MLRRRRAKESLHEFMAQAWPWIEAGRPFVDGWHLQAICEHLEAVVRGEIKNLLINIPFRLSKSTTVAVAFPAWAWVEHPELQFLFASYAQNISVRDSRRCRALIQSRWYQSRWGNRFSIVGDQDTKIRFENDHNGYRIASSVDGQNTGEGGDILCVSADTILMTRHGPAPISTIVSARNPVDVLSFDHATGKCEWQPVDQFHDSGTREVFEIDVDGATMRCTGNHPVWVEGRGYVRADEVRVGDKILSV